MTDHTGTRHTLAALAVIALTIVGFQQMGAISPAYAATLTAPLA